MAINAKLSIATGAVLLSCTSLLWAAAALAQAFPEESQPGVGAVLHQAPHQVRIRFDSRLEDVFSIIVVKDATGERISGRTKLDPDSLKTLEVSLPALKPGEYHVYWTALSWDGHRTKGDYVFHFKPQ